MKILLLSGSHPHITAGIVAYDILNGLSSVKGNDVRIVVKAWDRYENSKIIPIETFVEHYLNEPFRLYKRIKRKLLKSLIRDYKTKEERFKERFNFEYAFEYHMSKTIYSSRKILKRARFNPDIILVLFMSEFISFKNLHELNKKAGATIFIYPMDMAPFTGGCHSSWNCNLYQTECNNCPALYSNIFNDQANKNFIYKKNYIKNADIEVIAGSEYLFTQISKSTLFKNSNIQKVLLPINYKLFKPVNKIQIRKELGLPIDKKIVLIRSISQKETHKGYKELQQTLYNLANNVENNLLNNIFFVAVGFKDDELFDKVPFPKIFTGQLTLTNLSKYFQAVDLFLNPSIEDSGPMMVNQSIMSGIPVVSFHMGVALDLVRTGETGYRAKLKDSIDLANGVKYILELKDDDYNKMSINCRELGLRLCQLEKKGEEFMKIFNKSDL
jgi:glycosyltransferase involved in cell wall biosynthesis